MARTTQRADADNVRGRRPLSFAAALVAGVMASACGASSRSGTAATGCGDAQPSVTAASSDMAPHVGELVTLSAQATAADGELGCMTRVTEDFTYAWMLTAVPAESHTSLNATSVAEPSFTIDAPGEYVARVVATDAEGHASDPVEIRIEANSCGANAPVVSLLTSAPAMPVTRDTVTLGASVTDADTDPTCDAHAAVFAYAWSFSDLPPGSRARLNDAHIEHPSFVADVAGTYALSLVVKDPTGREGSGSVMVDVNDVSP